LVLQQARERSFGANFDFCDSKPQRYRQRGARRTDRDGAGGARGGVTAGMIRRMDEPGVFALAVLRLGRISDNWSDPTGVVKKWWSLAMWIA